MMPVQTKSFLDLNQPEVMGAILSWWRELSDMPGDRAILRRCRSPEEVAFIPAYHRLRKRLLHFGFPQEDVLAMIAGVLAHVKADNPSTDIAAQMANPKGAEGKPRISELKFRRMLQIRDPKDLYQAVVRLVKHLDGVVNIPSLAKALYWWNDRTRREWAFSYYEKVS